jgi:tyrosyl-tRNA synthetase
VQANCQNWLEQAYRVLDPEKTIVRYNADWLAPLTLADVVQLASHFTVAEFLAHETFKKRMAEERPLYIHEFIYALMQAYDAHHMQTDVQVGGVDQLFNIMAGRKLQEVLGEAPLIALCTPLLIGTDGVLKMSKSVGNSINMDMTPADMYGKLMSIPDSLMSNYYTLLTDVPQDEIDAVAAGKTNPMQAKKRLAREVVALLHDEATADDAQSEFERVFQQRQEPQDVIEIAYNDLPFVDVVMGSVPPELNRSVKLASLVSQTLRISVSSARRLIDEGAVQINGAPVKAAFPRLSKGDLIRAGRHTFIRVVADN